MFFHDVYADPVNLPRTNVKYSLQTHENDIRRRVKSLSLSSLTGDVTVDMLHANSQKSNTRSENVSDFVTKVETPRMKSLDCGDSDRS